MGSTGCGGEAMDWKHLLAYITGTVDQELLLRIGIVKLLTLLPDP
jgi:hypothetical protein